MKDRITSRANPRVKAAFALKTGPKDGLFLVEGFHLVEMARESGCLVEVYAVEDPGYADVDIHLVGYDIVEKLSNAKTPEPIVGVARIEERQTLGDRVLLLDRVQDPGNVGTLVRTALCFGFTSVYLTAGSANPYAPKAIAASQGSVFKVAFFLNQNGKKAIDGLRGMGYKVVGSSLSNALPLGRFKENPEKLCLILGNEGRGIGKELLALTDQNLFIEISDMESLNVAVAGGILMHRFRKE